MKSNKTILFIVIITALLIALLSQYNSPTHSPLSPQVLPASPTAKPTLASQAAPDASVAKETTPPRSTPSSDTLIKFRPGTLLTDESRNRIFYVTAGGTARRIESWMTFYALGFQRKAVLTIDNATLDELTLSGHLTQHLYDDDDYRYWVVNGFLWAIDAWQPALTASAYRGIPPAPIDALLLDSMPILTTVPNDILMRDGVKLYIKQNGEAYPVVSSSVYQAFGYTFNQAAEIPHGVMAKHDHKQPLTRFLQNNGQIYEITDRSASPNYPGMVR